MMTFKSFLCGTAICVAMLGAAMPASAATPSGAATAARGTAFQVSLSEVTNPKGRLAGASVEDKNGNSVGSVRDVIVDENGRPSEIRVDVGGFLGVGTRLVALQANELKYEQDRNVLITKLRKPQIEALPEIKA